MRHTLACSPRASYTLEKETRTWQLVLPTPEDTGPAIEEVIVLHEQLHPSASTRRSMRMGSQELALRRTLFL